jgi:hypothetical protein
MIGLPRGASTSTDSYSTNPFRYPPRMNAINPTNTITFQLTPQDYRDAIEAHHRSRRGSFVVRVISLIFLALGSLRLVSGDYLTGSAFFGLGLAYPILSARLAAYTVVRRKTVPQGQVELQFHDDRIDVTGPEFNGTLRQLDRVALGPRSILLYVDPSHYLVVPRRVFTDAAHYRDFVDRARHLVEVPADPEPPTA